MKKDYRKSIVLGFLTVYLVSMLFSTVIVKNSYENQYESHMEKVSTDILNLLRTIDSSHLKSEISFQNIVGYLMTYAIDSNEALEYQQISSALFEEGREMIAQSSVILSDEMRYEQEHTEGLFCYAYNLQESFGEDELDFVVEYKLGSWRLKRGEIDYPQYSFNAYIDQDTSELIRVDFIKLYWDETLENENYTTSFPVDFELAKRWEKQGYYKVPYVNAGFSESYYFWGEGIIVPYLKQGEEAWEKWKNDEYLQDYSVDFSQTGEEKMYGINLRNLEGKNNTYVLKVRQTTEPWKATFEYMKYVYLVGFFVTMACMAKVLFATEKTYKQQQQTESNRREVTNTIASDMKEPIESIRRLAEKVRENPMEEQDSCLEQIVEQTEYIDEMIKEMIHLSKYEKDR